MSFQVPGRVAKVNVQEGQSVTKDQIIAELDRAEFESRYEQAKANLDQSKKIKTATGNRAGYQQENTAVGSGPSQGQRKKRQRYI